MVNAYGIAIADVLKHPRWGLVSHQPSFLEPKSMIYGSEEIRVIDMFGKVHYVNTKECEEPTSEEQGWYWRYTNFVNFDMERENPKTLRLIELEEADEEQRI